MQNAPMGAKHSAILSTFIKLPFVINTFFVYFEWQLYIGFTVGNEHWLPCFGNEHWSPSFETSISWAQLSVIRKEN